MGPTVTGPVQEPLVVLFLDNWIYISYFNKDYQLLITILKLVLTGLVSNWVALKQSVKMSNERFSILPFAVFFWLFYYTFFIKILTKLIDYIRYWDLSLQKSFFCWVDWLPSLFSKVIKDIGIKTHFIVITLGQKQHTN